MLTPVEFQGKDIEEAINNAATTLGVPPERIKFTVISVGSRGFLGFGRKQAAISVTPHDHPLPQTNKLPSPKQAQAPSAPQNRASLIHKNNSIDFSPPSPSKSKDVKPQGAHDKSLGPRSNSGLEKNDKDIGGKKENISPPIAPNRYATSSPNKQPAPFDWSHLPPPITRPSLQEKWCEEPPDEFMSSAFSILKEIVTLMGFEAEIKMARIVPKQLSLTPKPSDVNRSGSTPPTDLGCRVILSLESANSALLIGRRGSTLEALSLLVDKMVRHQLSNNEISAKGRIIVDVADYRHRRQTTLLDMLTAVATTVRRTKKPQLMPGLSTQERRLIHLALKPVPDLFTQSVGDGGAPRDLTISTQRCLRRPPKPSAP
ncbi:MAG: protein jag [Candidatus Adiutrix sp.]